MPLHHNFKHLALGSNPIHMTCYSDTLYSHWRVIKFKDFPLSTDNISQGLYAPQQQFALLERVVYLLH